ncbi:Embryonic stem cell-specific 5-hydroxymethylcytosine-binding protein [Blattella germanica]|nr:Embryonic stem cell-specific 5-hydroxymethylcytosine-binding protein [Blattella germanica]
MCGRTACALCKEDVQKACTYRNKTTGKYELPKWRKNSKNYQEYTPSHNVCPTDVTPVVVSGKVFQDDSERMLQPMMWGMGDYKSHGLTTNNCRIEGLLSSKLYSKPFNKGNRCIIICDGFYEWQTTKGKGNKQPYFIYMPQEDGVHVEDPTTWTNDWDDNTGWRGPKLLCMAGIFDIWTSPEGEEIYSYSVITMESNDTFSWLHHRMPAILQGDQIEDWLDVQRITAKQAYAMIHPIKLLTWHPVNTMVNNSRNKDPVCNKPVNLEEKPKPKSGSQLFMQSWLKKGTVKREIDAVKAEPMPKDGSGDGSSSTIKKIKKEEESPTKSD